MRASWQAIYVDGRGSGAPPGVGLSGLAERVRAAGGRLSCGSVDGGGFRVTAAVPVPAHQPVGSS